MMRRARLRSTLLRLAGAWLAVAMRAPGAAADDVDALHREQQRETCREKHGDFRDPYCLFPPQTEFAPAPDASERVKRWRTARGRPVLISDWHAALGDGCDMLQIARVGYVDPPRGGKLAVRAESLGNGDGAKDSGLQTPTCAQPPEAINALSYRPDPGFSGLDRMTVIIFYSDGDAAEWTLEAQVAP